MTDVMVDIETLGKRAGCAILSIGACAFNPHTGEITDKFYKNVDFIDAVQKYDFSIDPETVEWWLRQSEEARSHLSDNQEDLIGCLLSFDYWFERVGGIRIWSQGAAFDFPILEEAYRLCGRLIPWKFWNVRDTRTVYDVFNFDSKSVTREGTHHNALDDCEHQVKCVYEALKNRAI